MTGSVLLIPVNIGGFILKAESLVEIVVVVVVTVLVVVVDVAGSPVGTMKAGAFDTEVNSMVSELVVAIVDA